MSDDSIPSSKEEALIRGLSKYVTGVACKYGHVCERRVSDTHCIECSKIRTKKAKQKESSKKKAKETNKIWYENNKGKAAAKAKEWRNNNSERAAKRRKEYYQNNKRATANAVKAWRAKNPDKVKKFQETYRRKNGPKIVIRTKLRSNRLKKANGFFTYADISRIYQEQEGECAAPHCRKDLTMAYDIDHIVPLCKGGSNWPSNIQLMCQPCNDSKGSKSMEEWVEWKNAAE